MESKGEKIVNVVRWVMLLAVAYAAGSIADLINPVAFINQHQFFSDWSGLAKAGYYLFNLALIAPFVLFALTKTTKFFDRAERHIDNEE
ncbi:hypothetical protein J4N45_14405 [Vibrio sp. SCSIO 43140]|uniref:hypothetical protein n=1 Tax=Vibrio sp. SCSIO 43140 TaxID=2819100 RepID=UPI0020761615|nr:hypothetical protein [Vibrio sp. SCSIO 43140]USD58819.1 hypothetical protein J4N45_09780 [Vibrio sp. SCSIO 43140]USD59153.1 hypothetical protein J4N45_11485 [Vibrio sp. SCSIO 43140]USD59694.1 hypothetical protein J4N45_14405 [Vibrio sp. SCSIO 43140]